MRSLKVNDSLTLRGIPETAFEYRLGNRSALDWVIDQYRVKSDARSGITSDPNAYSEDEQYIVNTLVRARGQRQRANGRNCARAGGGGASR